MYNNIENWKPYAKSELILNRAMDHIQSVEYAVSLRWVFYRLLQDNLYSAKADYDKWTSLSSRARRAYWNGWHPLSLVDETRAMIEFNNYGERPPESLDDIIEQAKEDAINEHKTLKESLENYSYDFEYYIDSNYLQDYFVIIAFEARAMSEQFKTYTNGLTLIPCGGQPSIPLRYKTAQYINNWTRHYNLPGIILYFGDCDKAGSNIFNSFQEDMYNWCENVKVIHCGLNEQQIKEFADIGEIIPENYEKPGEYQWEALTDSQARAIISKALIQYYDVEAKEKADKIAVYLCEKVSNAVNESLNF